MCFGTWGRRQWDLPLAVAQGSIPQLWGLPEHTLTSTPTAWISFQQELSCARVHHGLQSLPLNAGWGIIILGVSSCYVRPSGVWSLRFNILSKALVDSKAAGMLTGESGLPGAHRSAPQLASVETSTPDATTHPHHCIQTRSCVRDHCRPSGNRVSGSQMQNTKRTTTHLMG